MQWRQAFWEWRELVDSKKRRLRRLAHAQVVCGAMPHPRRAYVKSRKLKVAMELVWGWLALLCSKRALPSNSLLRALYRCHGTHSSGSSLGHTVACRSPQVLERWRLGRTLATWRQAVLVSKLQHSLVLVQQLQVAIEGVKRDLEQKAAEVRQQ